MTAPELLPCPFCGKVAHLRDDVCHSTAFFVGCETLGCFGNAQWDETQEEAVSNWNTRAALSADPAPVVGVTVQDIVHHIHRLSSAGDGLDGWLNPEGIMAREKWNKVKRDALRSIAGENAIAGENGNENG